jgi:phosphonate transport system ATP-binding protein
VVALRDGELVFDGPTSALTPPFLRDLYGTAADELLLDEPVAEPEPRRPKAAAASTWPPWRPESIHPIQRRSP